jgi:hypothetical protein
MIERRYLPRFEEGDSLRLGVTTPAGAVRWLDAYASTRSATENHYRLEASFWLTPLPLTASWPLSVPGRRSGYRRPRRTSYFRTWLSVRLRPFHCGITQRMLKRSHPHLKTGLVPGLMSRPTRDSLARSPSGLVTDVMAEDRIKRAPRPLQPRPVGRGSRAVARPAGCSPGVQHRSGTPAPRPRPSPAQPDHPPPPPSS